MGGKSARQKLVEIGPNVAELGRVVQNVSEFGQHLVRAGPNLPTSGQVRPMLAEFGNANWSLAHIGQQSANFGRCWSKLAKLWSTPSQPGQNAAQIGQCCSTFGRFVATGRPLRQLLTNLSTPFGQVRSSPGSPRESSVSAWRATSPQLSHLLSTSAILGPCKDEDSDAITTTNNDDNDKATHRRRQC